MRIDIACADRVGIVQEVLVVLARHRLNLAAVEVRHHHIYLDVPALSAAETGEAEPESLDGGAEGV